METKGKKKQGEKGADVDFGMSNLGLGGIFEGIGKLIDLAAKLKESGGEMNKQGEIDLSHLKEGMKGVFGFSVKSAIGGKQVSVEPFGHKIKETPKGPRVEEEREPLTDVFDEKDEVKIYAEMPGVSEGDIKLDLKGDILDIAAKSGERKYHKELLLSSKVKADTMASSYKNGMLEIKIKK